MRLSNRLKKVELGMKSRHESTTHQWWQALVNFEAKRTSGAEIRHEEEQRYARVYELIDIARARKDKALGIRRKPRVG